jgi:hypothetical protein
MGIGMARMREGLSRLNDLKANGQQAAAADGYSQHRRQGIYRGNKEGTVRTLLAFLVAINDLVP